MLDLARLHWLCADGNRAIWRYETDDPAEADYLLPLYEIVPGERSLFLLGREDVLAAIEATCEPAQS